MASIGQDEVWAAVRCVLEQIHPSGASHALRNPIISKTEVLNQQIEDMEVKCLKMQKKAVLQKTSIIRGLGLRNCKMSNDLKHAFEMNRRLINGRKEIIVESQEQLFQELEKQNLLKVRQYDMAKAVKLAEDKIAKIEEEQKHER